MIELAIVDSAKVQEAFVKGVKAFGPNPGVCLLLIRPYASVKQALEKRGIDTRRLFFIDTLSMEEAENNSYVQPANLTAMSIMITQALQAIPGGKKFLAIDSISTLAVHNPPGVVQKFVLFLAERLTAENVNAFIVCPRESTDPQLLALLKQAADKITEH